MNQTEILKYLEGQKTTRKITDLIVHCTATKPGAKVNVDVIDGWHKERGFKKQPQSGRNTHAGTKGSVIMVAYAVSRYVPGCNY